MLRCELEDRGKRLEFNDGALINDKTLIKEAAGQLMDGNMELPIKLEGAVTGFGVTKNFMYCLCRKTIYKIDKKSGAVTDKKEIFEKDGAARILTADESRICISDFCMLYVLDGAELDVIGKWRLGDDLSSDICGMTVDDGKIYCSVRNGKLVTVDKGSFEKREYKISGASMWRLKVYENFLLCGTVDGQLLLLDRDTMAAVKKMTLGRQNVRSLFLSGSTLYAACQDKKLFKIDLEKFEVICFRKNVHKKMFDCAGTYNGMLVTVSHPCSEIALWDMNTLEKIKEIHTPLSLSGDTFIDGDRLYLTSRNIEGVSMICLNLA